jgi:hypothetical protein
MIHSILKNGDFFLVKDVPEETVRKLSKSIDRDLEKFHYKQIKQERLAYKEASNIIINS